MKILVSGTTLNVTNAYAERDTVSGIITCTVIAPQSEIGYADLKALFKCNTEDIIKTDNDNTETFSGFTFATITDDDANEQYIVKLTSDEYSFQLGRNRQLEADKSSLESTVAYKENEISNLNTSIAEKDGTITEQGYKIVELEATIVSKDEEISAKDSEIAELLTIAEEYADMLYNESLEEMENENAVDESEVF